MQKASVQETKSFMRKHFKSLVAILCLTKERYRTKSNINGMEDSPPRQKCNLLLASFIFIYKDLCPSHTQNTLTSISRVPKVLSSLDPFNMGGIYFDSEIFELKRQAVINLLHT